MSNKIDQIENVLSLDDLKERRSMIKKSKEDFVADSILGIICFGLVVLLITITWPMREEIQALTSFPKVGIVFAACLAVFLYSLRVYGYFKKKSAEKIVDRVYILQHDYASYICYLNEQITWLNETLRNSDPFCLEENNIEAMEAQILLAKCALQAVFFDGIEWDDDIYTLEISLRKLCELGRNFDLNTRQLNFRTDI